MRAWAALVLLGCGAAPTSPCTEDLPPAWSPPERLALDPSPWTEAEQAAADRAVDEAFSDMQGLVRHRPGALSELGADAVEAFLDASYGEPRRGRREDALREAFRALTTLTEPIRGAVAPTCGDAGGLLTLMVYADTLATRLPEPAPERLRRQLLPWASASVEACADLEELLGNPGWPLAASLDLSDPANNALVYDLVMWSVTLLDASTVEGLRLPTGALEFVAELWVWLGEQTWPAAAAYSEGANDPLVYDTAYLVTHIGYAPTGYGRHRLRIEDAPWLHAWLRANFYAVLELGELDLVAEFVDLFRQYGCDETNDRQLRDGARHLLGIHRRAGGVWLRHREPYEGADPGAYDLLHKPWTAYAGLRRRTFEPPAPGTYGVAWGRVRP